MNSLGLRQKEYENATRYKLPRRSYTLIRIDGKAFSNYCSGLKRPFDYDFVNDMNSTAIYLCQNIMGAKFAYVQSDEISILLTDFDSISTQAWFENNIQKMVSTSASMATAKFNQLRYIGAAEKSEFYVGDNPDSLVRVNDSLHINDIEDIKMAEFDSRVWQIPQKVEVENYFIFRQQDATRNSISAVAQTLFSHKELEGVSSNNKLDLIHSKDLNWNEFPSRVKRGGFIEKVYELWVKPRGAKTAGTMVPVDECENIRMLLSLHGKTYSPDFEYYERGTWSVVECPIFSQDRNFLNSRIPNNH